MKIDKNTQLCISISSNPGNTGTTIHNALYQKHNLNFLYKSFKVDDIRSTMSGIIALGIRGCSVSMPFKRDVIKYLYEIDEKATRAESVNTVVNNHGLLKGYNTDIFGVQETIKNSSIACSKAIVFGAGCTARSACEALVSLDFKEILVINRTISKAESLSSSLRKRGIASRSINSISGLKDFMLINCTSIGTQLSDRFPVSNEDILNSSAIFDVVCNETDLVKRAKSLNISTLLGKDMAINQALFQFGLYTGHEIDIDIERRFIKEIL